MGEQRATAVSNTQEIVRKNEELLAVRQGFEF
jgi:hypothetical protein